MSTVRALVDVLAENECHLLFEETSAEELAEFDAHLPSDTHLVRFKLKGDVGKAVEEVAGIPMGHEFIAAIRAYKMSDIFDSLHDCGYEPLEITQGFGRCKPKLWREEMLIEHLAE